MGRKPEIIDVEYEVITPSTDEPRYPHLLQLWRDLKGYAFAFIIAMALYFPFKWVHALVSAVLSPLINGR